MAAGMAGPARESAFYEFPCINQAQSVNAREPLSGTAATICITMAKSARGC